jgi:heptosyltransferase III
MRTNKGRILVVRGGALGDFILTLPAIAALRRQFPDAHLEVLGYPHIVQLAVSAGLVDRAQAIEARALAGFFARNGVLTEDLVDYFSDFDLVISYLYDPDDIFRTNVARCTGAQFIQGPHRPSESEALHAARVYLKPLERLAIFDADPVPALKFGQAEPFKPDTGRSTGFAEAPKTLALHPGSGSERKNWPEVKWLELVGRLLETTNIRLLLVGGEAEGQRLQRLSAGLPGERFLLAQSLALPKLALLLSACSGFVGHDSGISHLAAAVGLPGLLLWGDTREEIWRPPSPGITVLRPRAGLAELQTEEVIRVSQDIGLISQAPPGLEN